MTNTTNNTNRTSRVKGAFASQGGVRQNGGSLPIYVCNTCHAEVVWATSNRTGRKYLVTVQHNYNGARYYRGDNVHGDCAAKVATATAEAEALHAVKMERAARVLQRSLAVSQRSYNEGTITQEQYLADIEMYEAEYNQDIA